MFSRITALVLAAPRRILAAGVLLLIVGAALGAPVASHLKAGGFTVPDADSTVAANQLDEHFDGGSANLILLISAPGGADTDAARAAAERVTDTLSSKADWVSNVSSYWSASEQEKPLLRSKDGSQALVLAHVRGDDDEVQSRGEWFADHLNTKVDTATIKVGGAAATYGAVTDQTTKDLTRAELISIPLTAIALILVFGSLVSAAIPLSIGILAIVGTLAILRGLAAITDVSIYAMNMTTALSLALAIDYSLFMVSRFREELARGRDIAEAVTTTVSTAGRTVFFSACTVALSLAALAVFPLYFLRSFAYAGIAVVAIAAAASLLILPALLTLLGHKVNALKVRRIHADRPAEQTFWFSLASKVMRRPVIFGATVIAILLLLGSPFLRAAFGYPDDRVLPTAQISRQVGDTLRTDFATNAASALNGVTVSGGADRSAIASYVDSLKKVDGVDGVSAIPKDDAVRFDLSSDVDPFSHKGIQLVRDIRAVDVPADMGDVHWTGWGPFNVDAIDGIAAGLPWALGLIALTTFLILFLFTGSIVVPLKALILNLFSLTATFGAMVWVFQEGHLSSVLGFTPAGYLVANMVVLMFCLAFGMSMDYEVFLLSRIREEWVHSDHTHEANTRAVALGLGRTGRIVTAAAALMAIVFAAMVTSKVLFMQLFGLGLTLAVLMDATLVRGILVPAFMQLMGRANWWAPRPLARLHDRIGLKEE
ncbi:MMPL family transporter [Nocardioides sp. Kera G14]|uniref:MMPL family transporter n=1 Tax=Nocardioides sp. Kera G14 TaxID=2884264 RepID=UPI001D0F7535|nr:MMPL family transporter [Nocardioides sp. Kera G14]UDY24007.1 MMPL family transporter [Nocardioides sp. Kera G14]